MVQGTASGVGKSRIVEALCRILSNRGFRVAPFKAQNMALNSAVTFDGAEISRSTAQQAKAARTAPCAEMNPLLLKPKTDTVAQLVVMGRPYRDVKASDHFWRSTRLATFKRRIVSEALENLSRDFEWIVIEGAGSPAEVNLRRFDVTNMDVALSVKALVLIVSDIDKGGSLASLVGTMGLLKPDERRLVKGFILNKFRGDERLLAPALPFLRQKTGIRVRAVLPFHVPLVYLDEEDALAQEVIGDPKAEIDIAIIYHPHLANFTDFTSLALEPKVRVRFVWRPATLGAPDAIILPGTKNTSGDLLHMKQTGFFGEISIRAKQGTPVIGICGGYQMLGARLLDPFGLESSTRCLKGLALLNVVTKFGITKRIKKVNASPSGSGVFLGKQDRRIQGYEIHHGVTVRQPGTTHAFEIKDETGNTDRDGAVSNDGLIFGTYLHDLFSDARYRRNFVNALRTRKKLPPLRQGLIHAEKRAEDAIESWARVVESRLDFRGIL